MITLGPLAYLVKELKVTLADIQEFRVSSPEGYASLKNDAVSEMKVKGIAVTG